MKKTDAIEVSDKAPVHHKKVFGGFCVGEIGGFAKDARRLLVCFKEIWQLGGISEIEFRVKSLYLRVLMARHTDVKERLRALTEIAKTENMFANRLHALEAEAEEFNDETLAAKAWRLGRAMGLPHYQTDSFKQYQVQQSIDRKRAALTEKTHHLGISGLAKAVDVTAAE